MDPGLVARALDVNEANIALGNEVFAAAGATFIRNRQAPDIYDANHVAGVRASSPAEIEALLARSEQEYAHARHRRYDTDYRTPPEFIARLALEGYEPNHALLLLLEGELQTTPQPRDIRPVQTEGDWQAYWQLMILDWREARERQKRPTDEDVAARMFLRRKAKQPPVQNFLAHVDGRAVAYFNSWAGTDGVGQVEDLFTHPDFRHRGIATALIHHCVADARAKGADPVVIVAAPRIRPSTCTLPWASGRWRSPATT